MKPPRIPPPKILPASAAGRHRSFRCRRSEGVKQPRPRAAPRNAGLPRFVLRGGLGVPGPRGKGVLPPARRLSEQTNKNWFFLRRPALPARRSWTWPEACAAAARGARPSSGVPPCPRRGDVLVLFLMFQSPKRHRLTPKRHRLTPRIAARRGARLAERRQRRGTELRHPPSPEQAGSRGAGLDLAPTGGLGSPRAGAGVAGGSRNAEAEIPRHHRSFRDIGRATARGSEDPGRGGIRPKLGLYYFFPTPTQKFLPFPSRSQVGRSRAAPAGDGADPQRLRPLQKSVRQPRTNPGKPRREGWWGGFGWKDAALEGVNSPLLRLAAGFAPGPGFLREPGGGGA